MRYIETDSITFWQVFQKLEDFTLAIDKSSYDEKFDKEIKGYLKDIPVYIKNERSSNNNI